MALPPGARLGAYEVTSQLGAGGMGEVYRAHDSRLGRDVAIKVISAALASNPDRVRRFEHEARAAAALSHPNILAVYDVGTHDATPYIVTELLAGTTLRERLGGGALPVRRAQDVGVQIASGLAAAHQKGIVHRDLKPENVFITDEGRVKILDFGLAKLTEAEPAAAGSALTRQAGTEPGTVMGTSGYMSPEQLRAMPVDARSDIFAFGAVLYELLSGARAFSGQSAMDVATAILKEDPPNLPSTERQIPPALVRIVDRCLEKNPAARFQSAGDLAFALEALSSTSGAPTASPVVDVPRRRTTSWLVPVAASLVIGAAAMYGAQRLFAPAPAAVESISFTLAVPDGLELVSGGPTGSSPAPIAMSPDGRHVAFLAVGANSPRVLVVRSLASVTARVIPGTEGAWSPFWSPDSREIGFFVTGTGKLRRVDIAGGAPRDICDGVSNSVGGSWSREGVIIFGVLSGLRRVPATGGTPTVLTTVGDGETYHARPTFLPDGRRFVYRAVGRGSLRGWLYLGSLDSPDRRTQIAETDSSNTVYSAGHLLYLRGQTLVAHPFDPVRGVLTGEPHPVTDNVQSYGGAALAGVFSASENGVLIYQPGVASAGVELRWFSRNGDRLERVGEPGQFADLRMSQDGSRFAFSRRNEGSDPTSDIWLGDTATGRPSRFTFDAGNETGSVFSPDGKQLIFNSTKKGPLDLYLRPTDDSAAEIEFFPDEYDKVPVDWSGDNKYLLFMRSSNRGRASRPSATSVPAPVAPGGSAGPQPFQQLWVLPMQGERVPRRMLEEDLAQTPGAFSPDGRFIAYTGGVPSPQIYVTPFPATGTKQQISTGGGSNPRWSRDGREIYFTEGASRLMVARVDASGGTVRLLDVPRALFPVSLAGVRGSFWPAPDGKRFLIVTPVGTDPRPAYPPVILTNWPMRQAQK